MARERPSARSTSDGGLAAFETVRCDAGSRKAARRPHRSCAAGPARARSRGLSGSLGRADSQRTLPSRERLDSAHRHRSAHRTSAAALPRPWFWYATSRNWSCAAISPHSLPDQPFPEDLTLATWTPDIAGQFFEAYHAAFRERPGFPGYTAGEWITGYMENENLRPDWSLLACAGGVPVGFVLASSEGITVGTVTNDGYIIQVGVVPSQRRRRLASALLVESMRRMQAEGLTMAQLCVHVNNPGAIKAYESIGFIESGRRARFERTEPSL